MSWFRTPNTQFRSLAHDDMIGKQASLMPYLAKADEKSNNPNQLIKFAQEEREKQVLETKMPQAELREEDMVPDFSDEEQSDQIFNSAASKILRMTLAQQILK
jgi:hypothetical protein